MRQRLRPREHPLLHLQPEQPPRTSRPMNHAAHHTHSGHAAIALVLVLVPASAAAQVNVLPPELRDVTITEHLNDRIPADATFRDHENHVVRLGEYFDGHRPVVLQFAYYRCPMLCNLVTSAMLQVARGAEWTAGDQYDIVTLSIDPSEGPADSSLKREWALSQYRREPAQHGWHFLTGSQAEITRVARAVGFGYRYDQRQNQYAHPAAIMLLTPDGRIARYLYGIQFNPNDFRLGLLEASEGRATSTVERLIMFCYHYDPQGRRYVLVAMSVMKLGGVATIALLGGFLAVLWTRERRRANAETNSQDPHT
jgi:protein SCO1/2